MYHQWKRCTQDGKLPFICNNHKGEKKSEICLNCNKTQQVDIRWYYQNHNATNRRFMCKECLSKYSKTLIKCNVDRCQFKRKYISLFNTSVNFSFDNQKFTCVQCKVFVEKLENYQEVLDTDQFFSRKNIPGT